MARCHNRHPFWCNYLFINHVPKKVFVDKYNPVVNTVCSVNYADTIRKKQITLITVGRVADFETKDMQRILKIVT